MVEVILRARDAYDRYAAAIKKQSFDGKYDAASVIVTICIAIALYNTVEMILLMLSTFKKWKGLYFWSLNLCNIGVILYSLGEVLLYFRIGVTRLNLAINDIGWISMVLCQSLVLYSRLGLMLNSDAILNSVRWMIILDTSIICTAVIVLQIGSLYNTTVAFSRGYYYIEQIQLVWFTIQELIISGLYIWRTLVLLKVSLKEKTRVMVWQLFIINIAIILMDISLVTLQFLHFQLYQEIFKALVYSVKLKLELNILSKLVDFVEGGRKHRSMTLDNIDMCTIAGQEQAPTTQETFRKDQFSREFPKGHKDGVIYDNNETVRNRKASSSTPSDDSDQIDPIDSLDRSVTHTSNYTSRTAGRETDIMYADMLRDMDGKGNKLSMDFGAR